MLHSWFSNLAQRQCWNLASWTERPCCAKRCYFAGPHSHTSRRRRRLENPSTWSRSPPGPRTHLSRNSKKVGCKARTPKHIYTWHTHIDSLLKICSHKTINHVLILGTANNEADPCGPLLKICLSFKKITNAGIWTIFKVFFQRTKAFFRL